MEETNDSADGALSPVQLPRAALMEFIEKICLGKSELIATAEAAFYWFNKVLRGEAELPAEQTVEAAAPSGDVKHGDVPSLEITLRQAEQLVAFFGGHDCEVSVMEKPAAWADEPDGLYAYCTEYPDEGSQYLGPTEVDDDLAANGRTSPAPSEKQEASDWRGKFDELLSDYAGACSETAVFNVAQQSGMTVRMARPRYNKLIEFVESFAAPSASQVEVKVPGNVAMVLDEIERATRKFPTWPTDPLHAVAVLGEEFGELTKAVLQTTYEPHKVKDGELRTEAIQTAAMALRFLTSLDRYEFTQSAQHAQSSAPAPSVTDGEMKAAAVKPPLFDKDPTNIQY